MKNASSDVKRDAWYEEWFDREEYDLVYRHHDDKEAVQAVRFIEHITQPTPGSAILDMACGRGRHARALARNGYRVTGLDLSQRAINIARENARAENLNILFLEGDMRTPVCNGCFDGAVNLFTAFGYFESHTENLHALEAMADSLKPGAWMVQDFFNAPRVVRNLITEDQQVHGSIRITQRRHIEGRRVYKEIVVNRGDLASTFYEAVWLYNAQDFRVMYAAAGLTLLKTFGDYDGSPWTEDSPRLIMLARREPDGV